MPEKIEVTWGEETFQPARFQGFRLGPFKYTTTIREGETIQGAIKRAHKELEDVASKVFVAKQRNYLERLQSIRHVE